MTLFDSAVVSWANKVLFVWNGRQIKRRDYRERGESRAMVQHDILIKSLESKMAGDVEGDGGGWKIKLINLIFQPPPSIFVGGTQCTSRPSFTA
jgi:hypothetical protein